MTTSTTSIASSIARLQDPCRVAGTPRQLDELQRKISDTMTRLFRKPENGGNPFLFALAGPKPHFLATELHGRPIETAATDGKHFFWAPAFLASLDPNQVSTVMSHESYHVLFFHCDPARAAGKHPHTWNIAVDYVVDGVIEHDHVKSGRSGKYQLWGGPLGTPIPLRDLLDWHLAKIDKLPDHGCFADPSCHGMSPETIYDQIQDAQLKSPRRCKERNGGCGAMSMDPKTGASKFGPGPQDPAKKQGEPWGPDCCPKCGAPPDYSPFGPMDSHVPSDMTKDEVMGDMMRAAEQAEQMGGRGNVPAEIEGALSELKKPTLQPRDIIRHCFQRKAIDVGNRNDWKRYKRRGLAQTPPVYLPRKHDFKPKWVALVDCSGSMSDGDIANGVKEMQLVAEGTEGYMVPCDAVPYWDKVTRITRASDLKRTQVAGRGGTVFDQFFAELPLKLGHDFDLVVIITDGDCGHVPTNLRPNCDVLWIITNKRDFKPSFGRVCQLNPVRT